MAQNENYSQVDLRIGTEAQFNAKVDTLPAGTLFGITDATVSKADLSTDLKNEINGKYTKPTGGIPKTDLASDVQTSLTKANSALQKPSSPTTESAITINSSGTISTKPLSDIAGKTEVYVGSTTPTNPDEILWIDPNGTGGGGGSGGGKLYSHNIFINTNDFSLVVVLYKSDNSAINTIDKLFDNLSILPGIPWHYMGNQNHGFVEVSMTGQPGVHALTVIGVVANLSGEVNAVNMSNVNVTTIRDTVIEM